ncbi:TPA: hypothetical protein DIU27_05100, partial [Candidatus Collierbacteria bacterium]|nr:hypothetical protein [Candidatus Collierbacteria bacterium]
DERLVVNQADFPELPKNKQSCIFGGSKWGNAEEEAVVQMIADYALERGAWSAMPLEELVQRAKRNITFGSSHFEKFSIALDYIGASEDVKVIEGDGGSKFVVPQKKLAETLKKSTFLWI